MTNKQTKYFCIKMEKQFTIVIENTNDAPFNISLSSLNGQLQFNDDHPMINENSAIGTVVGTVVSLDEDAAQYLNFTLDDDAGKETVVFHL